MFVRFPGGQKLLIYGVLILHHQHFSRVVVTRKRCKHQQKWKDWQTGWVSSPLEGSAGCSVESKSHFLTFYLWSFATQQIKHWKPAQSWRLYHFAPHSLYVKFKEMPNAEGATLLNWLQLGQQELLLFCTQSSALRGTKASCLTSTAQCERTCLFRLRNAALLNKGGIENPLYCSVIAQSQS